MTGILAGLLGMPRWLKIALGAVAVVGLVFLLHKCAVREAVKADRSAANAEAATTARDADERAEEAGNRTTEEVEDGNDRAREAADGSDDPLGDALRSLRD